MLDSHLLNDYSKGDLSAHKPQRLLFLQSTSLLDGFGGIEYYLHDMCDLACELYGSENIVTLSPIRRKTSVEFSPKYQAKSITFSKNPYLQKLQNRFSLSYWAKAKNLIETFKPTVIVNGHVSLGPMAYSLHKQFKIPYATCVYGIECWGNLWFQDEWCLRQASHIISISHWTKKILMSRGYKERQIKIVQPQLPPDFEKVEVKHSQNNTVTLLTVSRLDGGEQYKGQDHVLRALSMIKAMDGTLDINYIIQGEGTDRERLEKLVEGLGLKDVVEFRGAVKNRNELKRVYQDADIYVMPSRFGCWNGKWRGEGFGIVYLEAAAFGVPSIAYNCGGVTDIIRNEKNGIVVEPDDIQALAKAVLSLAQDSVKRQKMGNVAKEWMEKNFTRPAIRKQLVDALDSF